MGVIRYIERLKSYQIDYYDKFGKRVREVVEGNYREAKNVLDERMRSPVGSKGLKKLFREYAEEWLAGKVGIAESTREIYRGILTNHLLPHFGNVKVVEIGRRDIQDFAAKKVKEKILGSRRINGILDVLCQILINAEVDELLIRNPFKKIEKAKVEKEERNFLRKDEILAFLKSAESENYPFWYSSIFTGLRKGELMGLKWGDVDWFNKKIHVRRTFSNGRFGSPKSQSSTRVVDMGNRLIEILKEHKKRQNIKRLKAGENWKDMDLVFPNRKGTPLDAHPLHREFTRILRKGGLRSMPIHSLRHTFVSILIATGRHLKYISNQLGDSSIKITLVVYGHLMDETHDGAMNKSEDFVFGQLLVNFEGTNSSAESGTH